MRRGVLLVGAGLLATPALWWWLAERRADAWFDDDPATVLRLADALASRTASGVPPSVSSTGDARYDGEWALVSCQMTVVALGRLLPDHPEREAAWRPAIHGCATWLATPAARAFGTAAWGVDGLEDPDAAHVHAYLGWTNLALAEAGRVGEEGAAELSELLSDQLADRTRGRPLKELETYPGEVFPPDLAAVVASLALDGRHDEDAAALVARFRTEAVDPDTGLLRQTLDADGHGRPRGSGTTVASWFLGSADPVLSAQLASAARTHLRDDVLGFGGVREVPVGAAPAQDVDSGPVLFGLSVSASSFGLASARRLDDRAWHRELYRSARLAGLELGGWFETGGTLGNAILLAMLTSERGLEDPAARGR